MSDFGDIRVSSGSGGSTRVSGSSRESNVGKDTANREITPVETSPSFIQKVFGDWATWEKVVFAVSTAFVALACFATLSAPTALLITIIFAATYVAIRWMSCSDSKEAKAARKACSVCADLAQCLSSTMQIISMSKEKSQKNSNSGAVYGSSQSSSNYSSSYSHNNNNRHATSFGSSSSSSKTHIPVGTAPKTSTGSDHLFGFGSTFPDSSSSSTGDHIPPGTAPQTSVKSDYLSGFGQPSRSSSSSAGSYAPSSYCGLGSTFLDSVGTAPKTSTKSDKLSAR